MSVANWSTTAADNASVDGINWAEGQATSTVNDSARQMMADLKDGVSAVVADIATMTALTKSKQADGATVFVAGYTSAGDGGGGTFYWDADATDTADGGTILEADEGGTGRWRRIYSGAINAAWFGFAEGNTAGANVTALHAAWALVTEDGGELIIPPGDYTTDNVSLSDSNTAWVKVIGYGATLTRSATTSSYTHLYHRKNIAFFGLKLQGYVDSGTNWETVAPNDGYGFRANSSTATHGDVEYHDCVASGYSYDGWYIDAAGIRVKLINCSGNDNVRNDFAFTHGQSVEIDGGTWGNDSQVLTKISTIDIEPNPGDTCRFASVKNLKAYHKVNFYGAASTDLIEKGVIDNVVFDGTTYGSTCGLRWYRVNQMHVGHYVELNGATLQQAGAPETADRQGLYQFRFINPTPIDNNFPTKNLLASPYNSLSGWTSASSSGSVTPNVDCYGFKGIEIDNEASGFRYLSQDVSVSLTEDTWFTYGGLIRLVDPIGGNPQGIRILFDGSSYYHSGDGYVSGAIKIPSDITTITFRIGSANSLNSHAVFTKLFLFEGFGPPLDVPAVAYWSAAPTTGTWAVGDIVYNTAPAAAGNIGWVCTTAGTPGTWKSFGTIAA